MKYAIISLVFGFLFAISLTIVAIADLFYGIEPGALQCTSILIFLIMGLHFKTKYEEFEKEKYKY